MSRLEPSRDPRVAAILRRGALRLALFPSFFYRREHGQPHGVGVTVARALADRIGVPLLSTEFASPPKAVEALAQDAADVALLGIDPARAAEVDFSPPLLSADFTYLVPAGSIVFSISDADRPAHRVVLVRHHAMDTALKLAHAERVYAGTPDAAFEMFRAGQADRLAGIRPSLLMYAGTLPGSARARGLLRPQHHCARGQEGRGGLARRCERIRSAGPWQRHCAPRDCRGWASGRAGRMSR
jgi:polar amino acid transport system substrate-binding protein